MFRSLRFRLTFWYGVTLAVILACSGFFWHVHLARELRGHMDEKLEVIASDVADFHLRVHQNRPMIEPPVEGHCQKLEGLLRRQNWGSYVQIVDRHGNIPCASNNLGALRLPLNKSILQQTSLGKVSLETVDFGKDSVRILTYPLVIQGEITSLIQVGESLAFGNEALADLRFMLLVFSPVALLAVCLGGWFLAGRVINPVVSITRTARKISAESLDRRLPVMSTDDEIVQLTETFNSMLARLEESFNKVRQFTADASHELRTPLAILKGETEVALRWAKNPEELRTTLESNQEEIDRMERILEDLLMLAKSEAGELRLEVTEISLSDLLQDIYIQGRTLGSPKEIEVYLRLEVDEEIRLLGDQLQLRRTFLNLVSNALKYTPNNGQVEIILARNENEAIVTVADTGIGIADEHLPRIFDRFYRVDEARNREVGGTGLGLAIVQSIVDAHGGRIEVTSVPGQGTAFEVHLPLQGPPPQKK